MISCLFHQPALRRHLDDNEPLLGAAKAHLSACRGCREMVAEHRTIIGHLSAHRAAPIPPPPFLHARIVNSIEAATQPERFTAFRWIGAAAVVIAVGVFLALPKSAPEPVGSWPDLGTKIAFNTSIPENPLEKEIHNLQFDTLNAAKALAANFWPETDSER
jgi:hypothetical protein